MSQSPLLERSPQVEALGDLYDDIIQYDHWMTNELEMIVSDGLAHNIFASTGNLEEAITQLIEYIGGLFQLPDEELDDVEDFVRPRLIEALESYDEEFFNPIEIKLSYEDFKELITIRHMSKKLLRELGTDDKCCAICQEDVRSKQHCSVLGCRHFFHTKCAKQWFTKSCQKPTCPMCRKDAREMETFAKILKSEEVEKRVKKQVNKLRRSERIFIQGLAKR
jgi:hypothetical protein